MSIRTSILKVFLNYVGYAEAYLKMFGKQVEVFRSFQSSMNKKYKISDANAACKESSSVICREYSSLQYGNDIRRPCWCPAVTVQLETSC